MNAVESSRDIVLAWTMAIMRGLYAEGTEGQSLLTSTSGKQEAKITVTVWPQHVFYAIVLLMMCIHLQLSSGDTTLEAKDIDFDEPTYDKQVSNMTLHGHTLLFHLC